MTSRRSADPVRELGGSRYEVDATLTLEDLNERLGLHLPTDAEFQTVGGLVFHELGRVPEPGESFRVGGVLFNVVEVADHRIRRVLVNLQDTAAVEDGVLIGGASSSRREDRLCPIDVPCDRDSNTTSFTPPSRREDRLCPIDVHQNEQDQVPCDSGLGCSSSLFIGAGKKSSQVV